MTLFGTIIAKKIQDIKDVVIERTATTIVLLQHLNAIKTNVIYQAQKRYQELVPQH